VILLLGAMGYIGTAFQKEISRRGLDYRWLSRSKIHPCDYTKEAVIRPLLKELNPHLVINCAAFIPQPSVDLCKNDVGQTLNANVVFPLMLSRVCQEHGIPLAHISTACLYGDKREYNEEDQPTRDFNGYCGLYLRTKFIAEQEVGRNPMAYIWRIRLPFDEFNSPRNYLTKLRSYPEVWDHTNSLTHRGDFVKAALDMVEMNAPYGVYNMVNPGSIAAKEICKMMWSDMKQPAFVPGPCTGSTLSTAKLLATGVKIRNVHEAVKNALENWKP